MIMNPMIMNPMMESIMKSMRKSIMKFFVGVGASKGLIGSVLGIQGASSGLGSMHPAGVASSSRQGQLVGLQQL